MCGYNEDQHGAYCYLLINIGVPLCLSGLISKMLESKTICGLNLFSSCSLNGEHLISSCLQWIKGS